MLFSTLNKTFWGQHSIIKMVNVGSSMFIYTTSWRKLSYKVLIAGGGAGGITMASRLASRISRSDIAIIEPSEVHYYQPYWTLVGGKLAKFEESERNTAPLILNGITWIKDEVLSFYPKHNFVTTKYGKQITYDFLIVALGMKLGFGKIRGLPEAFDTHGVCSNYSPLYVRKTANALETFNHGNAIFTQPVPPIKCAGAPQKIAYLADEFFRKVNKRNDAEIIFCTAMESMFSVPKYAEALSKVAESKNIKVFTQYNLVEVKTEKKEAVFEILKHKEKPLVSLKYEMLHVTPPMFPPDPVRECGDMCDSAGFLDLNKHSLQHTRFTNIFGIGDCTNLPTSKTAAAVAAQCGVLTENIMAAISKKPLLYSYNGYTSCPLVTGNKKGILAEFDYNLKPFETVPFDQSKERYMSYLLKKKVLPFLYWNLMLRGYWRGPGMLRKLFRFGMP